MASLHIDRVRRISRLGERDCALPWSGEVERKPRVFAFRRLTADAAADGLHHHVAEAKTNAGTLSRFSGCVKAFEDLFLR